MAVRKDFNTALLDDGTVDRSTVEQFFGTFETEYPRAVETLRSGVQTSAMLRLTIDFMTLQIIRSPLSRRLMTELLLRYSPKSDSSLRVLGVQKAAIELLRRAREGDSDAITKIGLQSSAHLAQGVSNILKHVSYRTVRINSPSKLITSDHPVAYFSVNRKRKKLVATLPNLSSRTLCFFPLASDLLLFGDTQKPSSDVLWSDRPSQIINSVSLVKNLNAITALTAERTIVSGNKRDLEKSLRSVDGKKPTQKTLFRMYSELAKAAMNMNSEHREDC